MTNETRVLIADDHPLFRNAIAEALTNTQTPVEVRQADSLEATLTLLDNEEFDLVLLDLKMPGSEGLLGLIQIRSQHPQVAVAVVTANEAGRTLSQVRAAGALGYLPKSTPLEQLVVALDTLLTGAPYFPETLGGHQPTDNRDDIEAIRKLATLTPQQQRVLTLIARGFLNKQIAFELDVKETTVKTHVSEIFRKLSIYNRTQAAMYNQYLEVPE